MANVVVAVSLELAEIQRSRFPQVLLLLNATALIFCVLASTDYFFSLSYRYPTSPTASQINTVTLERFMGRKRLKISTKYGTRPQPGTHRILFLGSSQTWGSGATREEECFVSVIQDRLDRRNGPCFECINGGINGANSRALLELFMREWIKLEPETVVINLSHNDAISVPLAREFESCLERFVAINESKNIKTVFVLEANSIEATPGDLQLHPVMRTVGIRHGVPVVELHAFLKTKYDCGFLWWDSVHPTSFGHRLIADCILGALDANRITMLPQRP